MAAWSFSWSWRRGLFAALVLAGCGPVQYIATVTMKASSDVAAAREANAERYAPYEYTAATEFLHTAREEEGYADHAKAVRFGRLASEHAVKAKQIALEGAGKPEPVSPAARPVDDDRGGTPVDAPETENPIQQVRPK